MRLGVFDSGMGGLLIARSISEAIPNIDMTYLGDTLHLPYGARSTETIYNYTKAAIEFLFQQDCRLVIVACNTASAAALRQIQQSYLPQYYPDRRVLGVVVPTLEVAFEAKHKNIGLIGTNYIIGSEIYKEELQKIDPDIQIYSMASPLLVPLIENHGEPWLPSVLESYLAPLKEKEVDSLILGCTHYVSIKEEAKKIMGEGIDVISQDEIIPTKLAEYLERHSEINNNISYTGDEQFFLTDITSTYLKTGRKIYGRDIRFQKAEIAA